MFIEVTALDNTKLAINASHITYIIRKQVNGFTDIFYADDSKHVVRETVAEILAQINK